MKRAILSPRFLRLALALVLPLALASLPIRAADTPEPAPPPVQARAALRRAMAAYEARDHALYLREMQSARALQPDHPTLVYNLAGAFALNGRRAEALAALGELAGMGVSIPAEKDDDFASIRGSKAFAGAIAALRKNLVPRVRSRAAFTFPGRGLIVESVAFDPKAGVWYASSARQANILKVASEGGAALELSDVGDALWSTLGLRVDAARRALWVASSETEATTGLAGKPMRAGLFRYDLDSGHLTAKFIVPEDGARHVLGDCLVRRDGAVFATDSSAPIVWWLPPGGTALEKFTGDARFLSLQGLAFSPDEKTLFVADYSTGLLRIELASREVEPIPTPAGATLLGIDGLWFHAGALIGTQNGITPQRVVRVPLGADFTRARSVEILEAANPLFDEITLGTIVGDDLFFVANSQWNRLEAIQSGIVKDLKDPIILRLPLAPPAR